MKAAWYEKQGPAREVLVVGDMPDPMPGPERALPDLTATVAEVIAEECRAKFEELTHIVATSIVRRYESGSSTG